MIIILDDVASHWRTLTPAEPLSTDEKTHSSARFYVGLDNSEGVEQQMKTEATLTWKWWNLLEMREGGLEILK